MQTTDAGFFFRAESDLARSNARQTKFDRMKRVGEPISLGSSKVLRMLVSGDHVWTAESNATVTKRGLETGKPSFVIRGHKGPVSAFTLARLSPSNANPPVELVISGSWDKHIRVHDAEDGRLMCCTLAHADFVKALLVVPHLRLLVSGGSDKEVRFWDLSSISGAGGPLICVGSIKGHSRPIECLGFDQDAPGTSVTVYTADTMGVIFGWKLDFDYDSPSPRVSAVCSREFKGHTTGVTDMRIGRGYMWTASSDSTVLVHKICASENFAVLPWCTVQHPAAVKSLLVLSLTPAARPYLITGCCDEKLRLWDVSAVDVANGCVELKKVVDVHSHDITSVEFWIRRPPDGAAEAWVVTGSLDSTIRKWRLQDLLTSGRCAALEPAPDKVPAFELTEEEEHALLELEEE